MKKVITIITVVILGIIVSIATIGYFWYNGHIKDMASMETQEIMPGVNAIKNKYVNAYILNAGDSGYICIDAGLSESAMQEEMEKLSLQPALVTHVFLTHTDYDHVGGIALFAKAEVLMPEKEKGLIDGSVKRALFMKNRLSVPYTMIHYGQTFHIGNLSVVAIDLSGHTIGHTGYLVNNRYLFSGDAVRIKNDSISVFIPDFNMDTDQLTKSINKITNLPDSVAIFTGHYGYCPSINDITVCVKY